jgi:hypothetical protein
MRGDGRVYVAEVFVKYEKIIQNKIRKTPNNIKSTTKLSYVDELPAMPNEITFHNET